MSAATDVTFRAMGSEIRLIVGEPGPGGGDPAALVEDARAFLERYEQCLSRFRPDSELCALERRPTRGRAGLGAAQQAVAAGLAAARATDGLVDPTLCDRSRPSATSSSREGATPARLQEALLLAPARAPADPTPSSRWAEVEVDDEAGTIRRPRGVRFDSGGIGKGLAADLLAERMAAQRRFVVGCGGDLRVGGTDAEPFEVLVEHPLTGEHDQRIRMNAGAVATSGINVRVWRRPDGRYAHHLLDPSTGEPAWTGLIGATALAPTGVEAETLSKAALLSGPEGARRLLARHGGLILHDHGEAESVGPISAAPNLTVRFDLG